MADIDGLTRTGLILFIIIAITFVVGFFIQYARQEVGATRLVVLGTRTALFLPLYSFFIFIGLTSPNSLAALNVPITIVEGYSFYCFYSLIVTNLGGPAKAVHTFQSSGRPLLCCSSWCPSDHIVFYKRTIWALFHLFFTRTIFITLSAIAFYSKTKAGKALYAIFTMCSSVILLYALINIILFCKSSFFF
jgi:hypothetical protein